MRVGEVQAEVRIQDETGRRLGQTGVQLTATELAPLAATPSELEAGASSPTEAYAEEAEDGRQLATFSPFVRPGWWRVTVRSTVHLQGIVEAPFDILAPDPNRTGLDPPTADPAAAQTFADAVARLGRLQSVRQQDALADGAGGVVLSSARYAAPDRFQLLTAEGTHPSRLAPCKRSAAWRSRGERSDGARRSATQPTPTPTRMHPASGSATRRRWMDGPRAS